VNLVENAVAVGGAAVSVDLEVRVIADRLEILVTDDGPGMSDELLRRVRTPFVSERAGGSGLGLAIADRVATAHGGQLSIDSALHEGTCIRIVLPICDPMTSGERVNGVEA
jgi:signal transduction histidine kinase